MAAMPSSSRKHSGTQSGDPIVGCIRDTSCAPGCGVSKALWVLIPAVLAMPWDTAAGSETTAVPPPNAVFQFQKDNRSHPWLHITTDSGIVERKVLRLDPLGLHGMSTPSRERLPESLPWNRIQRIDEVVTRAGAWSKVGAVTVGALGAGLGNAI